MNFAESIQHGGLPGATGSVAPSIIEVCPKFHLFIRFPVNYLSMTFPTEWKSLDCKGHASTGISWKRDNGSFDCRNWY